MRSARYSMGRTYARGVTWILLVAGLAIAGCGSEDAPSITTTRSMTLFERAWTGLTRDEQVAACERFVDDADAFVAEMQHVEEGLDDVEVGAFMLTYCLGGEGVPGLLD